MSERQELRQSEPGERGLSFGSIAEVYDRHRPEPLDEAVDWLLPGPSSVVEIGAGTGAFTRKALARAGKVTAVEPDPRMAAVLSRRAPGARVVVARGERVPLLSGVADALLAHSSWHWVEQREGFHEAARLLRPGGSMGLVWTGPDRSVPWVGRLMHGGRVAPPATVRMQEEARRRRHTPAIPDDAPFTPSTVRHFAGSVRMTRATLIGLPLTYSVAITLDEKQRQRFAEDVDRFVETSLELEDGWIDLPLRCIAWRAERL